MGSSASRGSPSALCDSEGKSTPRGVQLLPTSDDESWSSYESDSSGAPEEAPNVARGGAFIPCKHTATPKKRGIGAEAHETIGCGAIFGSFCGYAGLGLGIYFLVDPRALPAEALYGAAALVLIYWLEAFCCSPTCGYLTHIMSEEEFTAYVQNVQEADPTIDFSIQNYHYEYREHTDSEGRSHTTKERVNTHYASMSYGDHIQGHTDETLSPCQMIAMFHLIHGSGMVNDEESGDVNFVTTGGDKVTVLLTEFPFDFHPRDEATAGHYTQSRGHFYSSNTTDEFQDETEDHNIGFKGYTRRALLCLSTAGKDQHTLPWWMNTGYFVLATLLFLSIPFRLHFFNQTQKLTWKVLKHYSTFSPDRWTADPIKSLVYDENPAVSRVAKMGKSGKEITFSSNQEAVNTAGREGVAYEGKGQKQSVREAQRRDYVPDYWHNQDLSSGFDQAVGVEPECVAFVQQLVDRTFKPVQTRDRRVPLPKRMKVTKVLRYEDAGMWQNYLARRNEVIERGAITPVRDLDGEGEREVKTMEYDEDIDPSFQESLADGLNEFYLWHGTSPMGALGISASGFKLSYSGSNAGTMFGNGAYLAENSSKSDEYAQADSSGLYAGVCALLLCRAVCGEMFYVTESDIPAIDKAMHTGDYDGVLGDRERVVGTYREFVLFDEHQIYPEYVVLYKREY